MAHFRGTLQGNRGLASRLGTKTSGLTATVRGWEIGVQLEAIYSPSNKNDEINIYVDGGSNNTDRVLIGTVDSTGIFTPVFA